MIPNSLFDCQAGAVGGRAGTLAKSPARVRAIVHARSWRGERAARGARGAVRVWPQRIGSAGCSASGVPARRRRAPIYGRLFLELMRRRPDTSRPQGDARRGARLPRPRPRSRARRHPAHRRAGRPRRRSCSPSTCSSRRAGGGARREARPAGHRPARVRARTSRGSGASRPARSAGRSGALPASRRPTSANAAITTGVGPRVRA